MNGDGAVEWSSWSQFILRSIEDLKEEVKSLWESVSELAHDSAASAEIIKSMSHRQDMLDKKLDDIIILLTQKSEKQSQSSEIIGKKQIAIASAFGGAFVVIVEIIKAFF